MIELLKAYFEYLTHITTTVGLAAFLMSYLFNRCSREALLSCLTRAATWCGLPNGLAFLICSADSQFVTRMADVGIAFFMGGLALVVVALFDISPASNRSPKGNGLRIN